MKNKFWFTWIAALFLFTNVHGRELQYPPQQRTVETPIAEPGGRSNVPLIVCSSVLVAVVVALIVRHGVIKHRRQVIVYKLYTGVAK